MGLAAGTQMAAGALGAGTGIFNMIRGAKESADAKRAMAEYERQKLNNVADGLQVSTLGSDLQRQEQARLAASQNQMLQDSGTRGIVGGLGKVEAGNQKVMQETGANLDEEQRKIEAMQAEDNARIRTMQESRENADLAALSSQYQSGKLDSNMGMGNLIQSAGMLGQGIGMMNSTPNIKNGMTTTGTTENGANTGFQSSKADRFNTNYNTTDANFVNGTGYQTGFNAFAPQYLPGNVGPQQYNPSLNPLNGYTNVFKNL